MTVTVTVVGNSAGQLQICVEISCMVGPGTVIEEPESNVKGETKDTCCVVVLVLTPEMEVSIPWDSAAEVEV